MTLADELQKLQTLKESGTLTEEEFLQAKATLLKEQEATAAWNSSAALPTPSAVPPPPPQPHATATSHDTRTWSVLLHISQFCWFIPLGGVIAPLVIWLIQKDRLPGIGPHFRAVMNWHLSALLYAVVCVPLVFVLVGIPILIALGVVAIVFPIMGAVKASRGECWRYPMSIPFLG